jgi:hypothetical protein
MCLNETTGIFQMCRHFLSGKVGWEKREREREKSVIAVIFNCALEYAMRKVQADQEGPKMVHISFLVNANEVN